VTQNVTTFFISFLSFAESVYSYEVRCMIWIKKTMYMPLWLKTIIATQVYAQEALTHLYVDAIKEYHAWYATNWKNPTWDVMHVPQEASIPMIWWWNMIQLFGNIMHDMQSDIMKCMNAEWHNEMHVFALRGAYFLEMWCMIQKCYAWLCLSRHLFICTLCTPQDDD